MFVPLEVRTNDTTLDEISKVRKIVSTLEGCIQYVHPRQL